MKKILLTLALVVSAAVSYGQGTIQLANSVSTPFQLIYDDNSVATGNVPANHPLNFGVFFGTSSSTISTTAVTPLATMSATAGVITGGTAYQLPGTSPNQTGIFMQIRGWSSSFGSDWAAAKVAFDSKLVEGVMYGETVIRGIGALGASTGPGAVIWTTSTTSTTRFLPMQVHVAAVPEPSTIALGVLGMAGLVFIRRRK
jgi:hypothetical protein